MKPCPDCAEQIQDEARVCRFCGRKIAEPTFDELTGSSAGRIVGITLAAFLAIFALVVVVNMDPSPFARDQTENPTLSAAQKSKRLDACASSARLGKQIGLILGQRDSTTIEVDESLWGQMAWEQKMILMDCLSVIKAAGGKAHADDIVLVYGHSSGKVLASGSPAAGTLAPQ